LCEVAIGATDDAYSTKGSGAYVTGLLEEYALSIGELLSSCWR